MDAPQGGRSSVMSPAATRRSSWQPLRGLLATFALLLVTACGGAGGGQDGPVTPPAQLPAVTSFVQVEPQTPVYVGDQPRLKAVFENGTGNVDKGIGLVQSGVEFKAPVVTEAGAITYLLTVSGAGGPAVSKAVTVTVLPASPRAIIDSFVLSNSLLAIYVGQQPRLVAVFQNGTGSVDQGVGLVQSGIEFSAPAVPIAGPVTFTLTVAGVNGVTVSKSLVVNVQPLIPGNLTAALTTVHSGYVTYSHATTVVPVFSGGSGVMDNGIGPVTSGRSVTITPSGTAPLIYTLTVTPDAGVSGSPVTATVLVIPVPGPVITSFTVN